MDPWANAKSTGIFVLLVPKFSRYGRFNSRNELVEWNQWYVLTSLSWLDETLLARVRKPFRCCDWLSQFLKRNFSWRKLRVTLSKYVIKCFSGPDWSIFLFFCRLEVEIFLWLFLILDCRGKHFRLRCPEVNIALKRKNIALKGG